MNRSRILRLLLVIATGLILIYGALCFFFSGVIIAFDRRPLEVDRQRLKIQSPADFGLPAPADVAVPIAVGELQGWFFNNPAARPCAVVLQHGHGGTRYGALKYAPLFWKRGCAIVSMDARRHGLSSGEFATYGFFERDDIHNVVHWLARRQSLRPDQIGLVGESMGAVFVLLSAARYNETAFVIADSPFSALPTILKEQGVKQYGQAVLPLFNGALAVAGLRAHFDPDDVSPLRYAPQIHIPTLLMHARSDEYTVVDHSRRIYAALDHSIADYFEVPWQSAHARAINVNPQAYNARLDAFLKARVAAFGR
ncbi:MAG: alpha/beta fold hydrolase [Leptospirales bacterium]|nr:alpha/beta fold hydrolase [Leptospirales bacterium]